MAEKGLFKITLADGTSIDELSLNGNNFISQNEITEETFRGKLLNVTIEGPEDADDAGLIGEHGKMKLARCQYDNLLDGYAFVLIDVPQSQIEMETLIGNVEYIAMMSDIEL